MRKIGPNHGIDATRKFLKTQTKTAWERLFSKPDEVDPEYGTLEGTLYKLVEGHNELTDGNVLARLKALEDKVFGSIPVPPEPPTGLYEAPQTYNKGSSGQDARYCTTGLPYIDSNDHNKGTYEPNHPSITYDSGGLCRGGRSGAPVSGLKPADMMDNKSACDSYEWEGRVYPPWPEASYY